MSRAYTWLPRGRALPPEVWAARHRGLLLILAGHLVVLPAFAVCRAGRSARRGCSTPSGGVRRGGVLAPPVAHAALLAVRDGAAELLGGPHRARAPDHHE